MQLLMIFISLSGDVSYGCQYNAFVLFLNHEIAYGDFSKQNYSLIFVVVTAVLTNRVSPTPPPTIKICIQCPF